MEDFYELLDLGRDDDRASIEAELRKLNKIYRNRVNLTGPDKAKVRNEATDRINLIARAMVKFRTDEERSAYDRELDEYKNQRQLQEPLIDVDFYAFLDLSLSASSEDIHRKLEELENKLGTASDDDETVVRQRQVINAARNTLLSPESREKYDEQISAKRAFEKQRDREKPVPLLIADVEVYDWASLEKALDQHPDTALFLLQDGEIEAWLRWSLGQKQRANWAHEIATRSFKSDTPFLEFEQFQRLINPNRPLILYERGGRPGVGNPVVVEQVSDIPKLADKHWSLFRQRLEYILDWMTEVTDHEALRSYHSLPISQNDDIRLERLLYAINPHLPSAEAVIEGISDQTIDFGLLSKWQRAEREITIAQSGRGYLYGDVKATVNWLKLSTTEVAGKRTSIHIEVVPSKVVPEQDNQGQVILTLVDGRVAPISFSVQVRQRTAWQSIQNSYANLGITGRHYKIAGAVTGGLAALLVIVFVIGSLQQQNAEPIFANVTADFNQPTLVPSRQSVGAIATHTSQPQIFNQQSTLVPTLDVSPIFATVIPATTTPIPNRPTFTPRPTLEPATVRPTLTSTRRPPTLPPTVVAARNTRISGSVDTDKLNARTGPGPEYDGISILSRGTNVTAIGRNSDGTWVQIESPVLGWVNARLIAIQGSVFDLPVTYTELGDWQPQGNPSGAIAIAETVLRIRGGPGEQYRQLSNPDILDEGEQADIVGVSADGFWYLVNIDNRSGWINARFTRVAGNHNVNIPVIYSSDGTGITPIPQPTTAPIIANCPGSRPPRLTVGENGRVTSGARNNVRSQPETGNIVGQIPAGEDFTVLDGPVCGSSNGLTWWQVRYNNITGWTAEGDNSGYWLEPIP